MTIAVGVVLIASGQLAQLMHLSVVVNVQNISTRNTGSNGILELLSRAFYLGDR